MSLNKVMLIGNVGRDPEVRYLEGNQSQNGMQPPKVASFTLATTERFRDRNNELRENTEWHNIVVWRSTADLVEKYVRKGTQIYVEGRLRTRNWDDQSGQKHYVTEIVADSIQLLGKKQDNPAVAQAGGYQPSQGSYQQPQYQGSYQQPQYQGAYRQPQQGGPAAPSYSQPAGFQPVAPAQSAPLSTDNPEDDLPF